DGTPLWAHDTGGVDSSITIAEGFVVVLAGPSAVPNLPSQATPEGAESELDWVLIGIDLVTGEYEWKGMSGSGDMLYSPYYVAQSPGSDTIYVLSRTMKNSLDVVDPTTGLSASSTLNFDQPIGSVPVNDGTHAFVQLKDGTLVATLLPVPPPAQSGGYVPEEVAVTIPTPEVEATPDAIAWRIDGVGSDVVAGDIVATANTVVRAVTTQDGGRIDAFDTGLGKPVWSKPMWWTGGIVLGDGLIYVPVIADNGITGSIVALDPGTGDVVWEQQIGGRPIMPTQLGTSLYVADDSGLISAFDTQTGEILWLNHASIEPANGYPNGPLPKAVGVSPKFVTVLYPTGENHNLGVFAVFDATSGKELYQLPGYPYASTQFTVVDNTLVILTPPPVDAASPTADALAPMEIKGIDLSTGDVIWENQVVTRFDEPIIVVGSAEGLFIQLIAE
ncbi:MAG: PQQ-binding-like beta-propeller repeat protein, partial [Thermomicrobiales bacterium]